MKATAVSVGVTTTPTDEVRTALVEASFPMLVEIAVATVVAFDFKGTRVSVMNLTTADELAELVGAAEAE